MRDGPWTAFDPDPDHAWNRLHRSLFARADLARNVFGHTALDPYLWPKSQHLRTDVRSRDAAIAALDDFLSRSQVRAIEDPLHRAVLQRDLWAVFDAVTVGGRAAPQGELESRLAWAILKLALPAATIGALPDPMEAAVDRGTFPVAFDPGHPDTAYLPPDLASASGEWRCVGRSDTPAAITHVQSGPFHGRSTFLVCIRAPGGAEATEKFVDALGEKPLEAEIPAGTEVALIRRALLIDDEKRIVPSPIVESIQLRRHGERSAMRSFEFELDRPGLLGDPASGLRAITPEERGFPIFRSHGFDPFESGHGSHEDGAVTGWPRLERCGACHVAEFEGHRGATAIITTSRKRFPIPVDLMSPLVATTPSREADLTIDWKLADESWARLLEAMGGQE